MNLSNTHEVTDEVLEVFLTSVHARAECDGPLYGSNTDVMVYIIDGKCDSAEGEGAEAFVEGMTEDQREDLNTHGMVLIDDQMFAWGRALMMAHLHDIKSTREILKSLKEMSEGPVIELSPHQLKPEGRLAIEEQGNEENTSESDLDV